MKSSLNTRLRPYDFFVSKMFHEPSRKNVEAVINISAEALEVAKSSSDKAKWHWITGKALRMLSSLADLPRDAEAEEHFGHAQRLYASTSDRNGVALAASDRAKAILTKRDPARVADAKAALDLALQQCRTLPTLNLAACAASLVGGWCLVEPRAERSGLPQALALLQAQLPKAANQEPSVRCELLTAFCKGILAISGAEEPVARLPA